MQNTGRVHPLGSVTVQSAGRLLYFVCNSENSVTTFTCTENSDVSILQLINVARRIHEQN